MPYGETNQNQNQNHLIPSIMHATHYFLESFLDTSKQCCYNLY